MPASTSVPIGSFLCQVGNTTLGQFTGLQIGDGLVAVSQGNNCFLDTADHANSATALSQANWYINALTGNDHNSGIVPTKPLKTFAELVKRWGRLPLVLTGKPSAVITPILLTTIYILSDLPASDPIDLQGTIAGNMLLALIGAQTTVHTGTLTGVVNKNRNINQAQEISDAGIGSWAPFVGKRIRITSGARVGQVAWIVKDLGGVSARTTSFSNVALPGAFPTAVPDNLILTGVSDGVMAAGDPYVIEDLTKVYRRAQVIQSNLSGVNTNDIVGWSNFDFQGDGGGFSPSLLGNVFEIMKGCRWTGVLNAIQDGVRHQYLNCFFQPANFEVSLAATSSLFRSGGAMQLEIGCREGTGITFTNDFLIQEGDLFVASGDVKTGRLAIFDNAFGSAIFVGGFGFGSARLSNSGQNGPSGLLWGSGNTAEYLIMAGGSQFVYDDVPVGTGAGADFNLAGAVSSRAWDETAGAYTALVANTWANLGTPIGGGGFDGNAHNVERSVDIVLTGI
jgi:hypothetical protein